MWPRKEMKTMKKTVYMLLILLFTASTGFAQISINEDNVQEGRKVTKKRYFFTKELSDLAIEGKIKNIPQNNKVIVPYFRVTFATGGSYLNSVGGVTTAKTKIYSSLNGVDSQAMQEITDAMYVDFLTQLTEEGYEVLDLSTLEENETYKKLQESSKYPDINKTNAQFTPNSRYFPTTVPIKAYMLARDVDALMLSADFTVNFIVLNRNEKKFNLTKSKAEVEVGQGINVFGEVSVIAEAGAVKFIIQQPISSDKPIGEVVDATTGMNKVSDGVALVGSLLGGKLGNRQSTKTVEVNTTPEAYKLAVADALNKSNVTLASYMAASINGEEISEDAMGK